MKQKNMFEESCADLPLFSGVAIKVKDPQRGVKKSSRQLCLPYGCKVCLDTGIFNNKRCMCGANVKGVADG